MFGLVWVVNKQSSGPLQKIVIICLLVAPAEWLIALLPPIMAFTMASQKIPKIQFNGEGKLNNSEGAVKINELLTNSGSVYRLGRTQDSDVFLIICNAQKASEVDIFRELLSDQGKQSSQDQPVTRKN